MVVSNLKNTASQVQIGVKRFTVTELLRSFLSPRENRDKRAREKEKARRNRQKITRVNRTALARARKAGNFRDAKCRPGIDTYLATGNETVGVFQKKLSRRSQAWLCSTNITYKEHNYSVQNNDIRVFIEGAEVTQYIRGTVRWTIESTGGMNTASFTLNNNHDAFIVTPANVCANLNKCSWQVHGTGWRLSRDRGGNIITHPGRSNVRADELAKYMIYRAKYKKVNPGTPGAEIDPETGVWLYPLNPFSSVLHKHDAVRIFTRLPQLSSVRRKNTREYYDLWMPAFTGFISNYNWEDDPVAADRQMHVQCYDIRGLYERMRVRINPNPSPVDPRSIKAIKEKFAKNQVLLKLVLDAKTRAKLDTIRDLFVNPMDEWYNCLVLRDLYKKCRTADLSASSPCLKRAISDATQVVKSKISQIADLLVENQKRIDEYFSLTRKKLKMARQRPDKTSTRVKLIIPSSDPTTTGDQNVLKKAVNLLDGNIKKVLKLADEARVIVRGNVLDTAIRSQIVTLAENASGLGFPLPRSRSGENELAILGRWLEGMPNRLATALSTVLKAFNTTSRTLQRLAGLGPIGKQTGLIIRPLPDEATRKKYRKVITDVQGSFASAPRLLDQIKNTVTEINSLLKAQDQLIELCKKQVADASNSTRFRRGASKLSETQRILNDLTAAMAAGAKKARAGVPDSANTMADVLENRPTFGSRTAGIFADLTRKITKNSHVLADMSFEQAVKWLVMENTNVIEGVQQRVESYQKPGRLEMWNRVCVFGRVARPLTFGEVTALGAGTITDTRQVLSPLNVSLNLLLPARGTGGQTIVQRHLSFDVFGVTSHQYETRKSMLDQICTLLDYQYYISPFGDFCFEFPNYNVLPSDYGPSFRGAYELERELISCNIAEEATDLPTAWVLTGPELDKSLDDITRADFGIKNKFKDITIMAPILARRLGVKVEHINVSLPGVGAVYGPQGWKAGVASLLIYGLFHINRQFGRAHSVAVRQPFRPYLLPNRPVHLIHRQRIGLIQSVTYSLTPPDGEATTETQMGYVRWLNRDGTFRNIGGGTRMPLDYTQFFSGSVGFNAARSTDKFSSRDPKVDIPIRSGDTVSGDNNFSAGPFTVDWKAVGSVAYSASLGTLNKPKTLSGSTAGAGGTSRSVPQRSNTGVGHRAHRRPAAGGSVVEENSSRGLTISSDQGKGKSGKSDQNRDTQSGDTNRGYDTNKLFHDPLPFFTHPPAKDWQFNSWGFFRTAKRGLSEWNVRSRNGSISWHSGVDIFTRPTRGKVYTPIRLHSMKARFEFGFINFANKVRAEPYKQTVSVGNVNVATQVILAADKFPFVVKKATYGSYGRRRVEAQRHKLAPTTAVKGNTTTKTEHVWFLHQEYDAWKAISKALPAVQNGSRRGLYLTGWGMISVPNTLPISGKKNLTQTKNKQQFRKLSCQLRYLHLSNLLDGPEGKYGIKTRTAQADPGKTRPLGIIGSTGNASSAAEHLHFEIWIVPGQQRKDKIYERTVKAVLKARNEFLTNMLLMKMTRTGGQLKADPKAAASAQLSETWKKKLRGKINVKNADGSTTVVDVNKAKAIDVVEAMIKSNSITEKFRKIFADLDSFTEKERNRHKKFMVHPLMFFTPEQIVDNPTQKSNRLGTNLSAVGRHVASGKRKGLVIKDPKDTLCKKLGKRGLEKLRLAKTIERSDKDRKARGSQGTVIAAKKRRQSQKKRRKDERRQERDNIRKTAMIRPDRLEGALHASVRQNLDHDTSNNPNQDNAWRAERRTFPGPLV